MPPIISSLVDTTRNELLLNVLLIVDHGLEFLEDDDAAFAWRNIAATTTNTMVHAGKAMLVLLNNFLDDCKGNHGCKGRE